MIFASLSEIISLGAVIPFLGALIEPKKIFDLTVSQPLINLLDLKTPQQILLPITIIFALAAITSAVLRLSLVFAITRLSFAVGADLSLKIYRHALYQPYSAHISQNTSEILDGVSNKINIVIQGVLLPVLFLITSCVLVLAIVVTLIYIEPIVFSVFFLVFSSIYLLIFLSVRKKLFLNGILVSSGSSRIIKIIQEGLGGIRDVILDGVQEIYCEIYKKSDIPLRRAQGDNIFIGQSPKYLIEAAGILLITFLAYVLFVREGGASSALPILGMLALGAQRVLPVLQQAYVAWTQLQGNQATLRATLDLLEKPIDFENIYLTKADLLFYENIKLDNLSFKYSGNDCQILSNINLTINKGEVIGFIGQTGAGKSTLMDLLMGLLEPTSGSMTVDGKLISDENRQAWRQHVAHVPQSIYLSDATILENIAFGSPLEKIDYQRVVQCATQANLHFVIQGWSDQYMTKVGERGVRLSGGQRQRIGIARALYKNADILFLDEATSSLDSDTETIVMEEIHRLPKSLTILIVAHRLSTLKYCDRVIELSDGAINKIGTYDEVAN